jgi:hypothetical protein
MARRTNCCGQPIVSRKRVVQNLIHAFEGLLFFADAGNGDQFAFAVAGGQVRRSDIFVWNHEDDSRTWLAKDLREYLEGWISGRITI